MLNIFTRRHAKQYACVCRTKEFIEIQAYAYRDITLPDPTVKSIILSVDASEESLGEGLKTALKQSRFLSQKESDQLESTRSADHQAWIDERMQQFGYKDKEALFKHMDKCFIWHFDRETTMSPQYHIELEHWIRDEDDDLPDICLTDRVTLYQLGAGLLIALSRCISEKKEIIIENPPLSPEDLEGRLQFEWAEDTSITYPLLHVYLKGTFKPFMAIVISEAKEPLFKYYAFSEPIKLTLIEWRVIRFQSQQLLEKAFSNEE